MKTLSALSSAARRGGPPPFSPAAMAGLAAWFHSDDPAVVTEPGFIFDYAKSYPIHGSIGGTVEQDTANNQPSLDRDSKALYFRSLSDTLIASAAEANWAYLSNATDEACSAGVFRSGGLSSVRHLFRTCSTSTSQVGFIALTSGTSFIARINNGSASVVDVTVTDLSEAVAYKWLFRKKESATSGQIDWELWFAEVGSPLALIDSGTTGTAPSGSSPTAPLSLGLFFVGWLPEAFTSTTYDQPISDISTYLDRWPLDELSAPYNAHTYLDPARSDITLESSSPERLTTIPNPGTAGGTVTQGTAADRPWLTRWAEGSALYFTKGGENLRSSLAASSYAFLHNSGGNATILFRFRKETPGAGTVVHTIFATVAARAAGSIGLCLDVTTADRLRITVMNGSGSFALAALGTVGEIQVGTTYTGVLVKSGTSVAVYLEGDMSTPTASGTISSPSASNPNVSLTLGHVTSNTASINAFDGFLGPFAVFDFAADETQRNEMVAELARYPLENTHDELIDLYNDLDWLGAAFTPDSLVTSGSNVTQWSDVTGNGNHWLPGAGSVTVDTLDGVACLNFTDPSSGWMENNGLAAIVAGTNTPFSVFWHGQLSGEVDPFYLYGDGGATAGWAHWYVADGEHNIERRDAGAGSSVTATAIAQASTQRAHLHVFHAANSTTFNRFAVDGTSNSPALNASTVNALYGERLVSGGGTIKMAYELWFNRSINDGVRQQLREASERLSA